MLGDLFNQGEEEENVIGVGGSSNGFVKVS